MPYTEQFLEYIAGERGYSPHTVDAYGLDLEQFKRSLRKSLLKASPHDIRKHVARCLARGQSAQTASRKLSCIRSFYQFVFMEGGLPRNPARHIRKPKVPQTIVRPTTGKEVDELLAAMPANTPREVRDRALLYVAFGSGLRASELSDLRIADLDFTNGVAKVRLGKGKKDRLVPMNQHEMEALILWLDKGRPQFAREPDNGHVFIGYRYGWAMTRQRLWQVTTAISADVLGRRVSPHKFRHAFVTETINGGADIRVVQQMAGHASINTTRRYLHFDFERLRSQYLKAHPRGA